MVCSVAVWRTREHTTTRGFFVCFFPGSFDAFSIRRGLAHIVQVGAVRVGCQGMCSAKPLPVGYTTAVENSHVRMRPGLFIGYLLYSIVRSPLQQGHDVQMRCFFFFRWPTYATTLQRHRQTRNPKVVSSPHLKKSKCWRVILLWYWREGGAVTT